MATTAVHRSPSATGTVRVGNDRTRPYPGAACWTGRATVKVIPSPGNTALAGSLDAGRPELRRVARHARTELEDQLHAAYHSGRRRHPLDRYPGDLRIHHQ